MCVLINFDKYDTLVSRNNAVGYFITLRRPLLKVNVLLAVLEKKNDKVHGGILVYEIPDAPQLYI